MVSNENLLDQQNPINNLVSFKDLFCNDHCFRIPNYQRGYSWNCEKELSDLWEDIIRLFRLDDDSHNHYTGMIILQKIEDLKNENLQNTNSFYVVDGQQRLTSLVIIIQAILLYAKENDIKIITDNEDYNFLLRNNQNIYRFGYSRERTDGLQDYFVNRIYNNKKDLEENTLYMSNINNAMIFIEKKLNYFLDEKIENILKIILKRLKFNIYFITEKFDVRVTF